MPLGPAGGSGLNPIDFKDKVSTNVENVIGRINGIAPQFSEEVNPTATPSPPKKKKSCFLFKIKLFEILNTGPSWWALMRFIYFDCIQEENAQKESVLVEPPQSVQRGVTELVEAALSARNLCMMDPTWHPWF